MFHIATIANRLDEYEAMKASFLQNGFDESVCRYTLLDNSTGNHHEPYSAIRLLLESTPEPYLIVCHQDVRLDQGHGFEQLAQALQSLQETDPHWAVAGNAGGRAEQSYLNLVDPNADHRLDTLPLQVYALDENFLILRPRQGITSSQTLTGFHLYGTDLCLNAMRRKRACYVIDFRLRHLSAGNIDSAEFAKGKQQFEAYWGRHFWLCLLRTPCTELTLSRLRFIRACVARRRIRSKITNHINTYYRLARIASFFRP